MAYRFTVKAESDLTAIYSEGVERFGRDVAERYLERLSDVLDTLATHPKLARERHELNPPARIHRFGAHIIIYVIDDNDILVLRVRHGREDWLPSGS